MVVKGNLISFLHIPSLYDANFTGHVLDSIKSTLFNSEIFLFISIASLNLFSVQKRCKSEMNFGAMFAVTEITPSPPSDKKCSWVSSSPDN